MSIVDFGKVASMAVPDDLSVDARERVYILSPDIPNSRKLKKIALEGEAVYPDDPFFNLRFGYADINTLGMDGTDDKVMVILGTEDIIRATLSFKLMEVPENNSSVHHVDVPGDPDTVREALPQAITHADLRNFCGAFAVNNFFATRPGQKEQDKKEHGDGAGRRLINTALRKFNSRYVMDTLTPTPKHEIWVSHHASWAHDMDTRTRAMHYLFYISDAQRRWAVSKSKADMADLEWGQVAHMAANGAGVGDVKTDASGRLTINFSYAHDYSKQYERGLLAIAEHLIPHVPEEFLDRTYAIPSMVTINRARPEQHPESQHESGLDGAHFRIA
jgi:hypothetical protein